LKGKFEVLLDLDGCLVDFIKGVIEVHNLRTTTEELYEGHHGCWEIIHLVKMSPPYFWKPMDQEFWAKLDWLPDGEEIFKYVEDRCGRDNITLWTTPSLNYGCIEGKLRWVERHLPRHYKHNIVFGSKKFLGANPNAVLIDDSDHNIKKFTEKGGHVVHVPRLWNSLYPRRDRVMDSIISQLDAIERGAP
jgi:5'(3')-deoxyribonucleotidase